MWINFMIQYIRDGQYKKPSIDSSIDSFMNLLFYWVHVIFDPLVSILSNSIPITDTTSQ
jgi:hypothetical protein